MTVVNPKSISGITSITTASGSDNLLTIHTSDANNTERLRIDSTGATKIVTGIVTTLTATTGIVTTLTVNTLQDANGVGINTANVRTGILDVAGIATFRDEVQIITDNKRLKFGAGDDLNIYSTGTNGWVYTPQSGADLYMGTNAGEIYLQTGAGGNDTGLKVDSNGRVIIGAQITVDTGGYYDDITLNNSNTASGEAGGAGLSIVSGSSSYGGVIFSRSNSHGRGYVKYDQTNDRLLLGTQTIDRVMIEDSGNNGDVHIKTGNIVFDTSGRGIDFSATGDASGMTSELLDDYEEGTFTLSASGGGSSFTSTVSRYIKIGIVVHIFLQLDSFSGGSSSQDLVLNGLPFTSSSSNNSAAVIHTNIPLISNGLIFQIAGNTSSANIRSQFASDGIKQNNFDGYGFSLNATYVAG
jgi:hypothetical protein